MKVKLFITVLITVTLFACNNSYQNAELKTYDDTLSYTIGKDIGKNFEQNHLDTIVNIDLLAKGLFDYVNGDTTIMTDNEVKEFITNFRMEKRKEAEEKRISENKIKFKNFLEAGEKYLEENAKKEGVIVTESGLQYKIIKEGDGETPAGTSKVRVQYEGKLIDGTIFDSSYEREKPSEFYVMQVIKGWSEGLTLMKEGSIYEFYIPWDLAYGDVGNGSIRPFSTLIFKVELLEIIDPSTKNKQTNK